jgi:phosphohistidine phosphatase
MKYLLLIRHAKTEQHGFDNDFERRLTNRGEEDCELMSDRLKKVKFMPGLIKISAAKRTRQTAKHLANHLNWKKEKIESFEKLYLASYKVLLYEIAHTNAAVDYLAIIAHNPGITELFNYIGNATIDDLPTCGMGIFTFDIDSWDEIAAHKGKLEWYSWPKKVKN